MSPLRHIPKSIWFFFHKKKLKLNTYKCYLVDKEIHSIDNPLVIALFMHRSDFVHKMLWFSFALSIIDANLFNHEQLTVIRHELMFSFCFNLIQSDRFPLFHIPYFV